MKEALNRIFKLLVIFSISLNSMSQESTSFACSYFPPYKIKNEGDHMGIDVDIISEVYKSIGKKNKYIFLPWKRALKSVENGELDALCGCSYLKSRERLFHYSQEVGKNSIGIFTLKDNNTVIKNIMDLNSHSVAVVRGYSLENELLSSSAKVVRVKDESQLIRLLKSKRVDAIYSFKNPIMYLLKKNKIENNLRYREFKSSSYYSCFSKKTTNADFISEFNKGLSTIRKNGIYEKILIKYLGDPI